MDSVSPDKRRGSLVPASEAALPAGATQRKPRFRTLLSTRRPLNNARTDVIATIETLPDAIVKYLFRIVYVSIFLAAAAVVALMVVKLRYKSRLRSNAVFVWNTAIASTGIAALTVCFSCYLKRIYLVWSLQMRWSERRRKGAMLYVIELLTQLINLCFYLAPNVYLLVHECGWWDMFITWMGFGRMTCWNTHFLLFLIMSSNFNLTTDRKKSAAPKRFDRSTFDEPLSHHAPKLLLWSSRRSLSFLAASLFDRVATEAVLVAILIWMQLHENSDTGEPMPCTGDDFHCNTSNTVKSLVAGIAAGFVAYFLGTIAYFRRGFQQLRSKQYINYRMSNILIRLQLRLQMIVHCFHIVSFALLWFVRVNTCSSFLLSWLGFLPSQFAMTVIVCVKTYLFIPIKPTREEFALQMWLREYSWSEEELPDLLDKRGNGCCSTAEPMFCYERALKTLYWSWFVYDYKQVLDSKLSLKVAMRLYDLTEYELFHEPLHDTKLLMGWNQKKVVLAFRGTSSLKNLFADLRVARIAHPPIRGSFMSRPLVHRGFLQTWTSNGLNERVLERLREILRGKSDFSVVLTGHSLGGAVAVLAAYDIRHYLGVPPCRLDCYTFGAPRVGNYAFAYDYDRLVPNTWNVINDQDYITRTMKFLVLYKRPGHRVIVNSDGDMLVRPSFIEMSLSRLTGAVNILDHFLGSYQKAFLAIARSQFAEDGVDGGYEGVLRISETLRRVLGVTRARLIQEMSWGKRIRELEQKKRREGSFLHHAGEWISAFCATSLKRLRGERTTSPSDDVDRKEVLLCGRSAANVKRLESTVGTGLSVEAGHMSLESQRTAGETGLRTELEMMTEELDDAEGV